MASNTKQKSTTLDVLVRKADPEFDADRKKEREYLFTGREFTANPAVRGAYAPEEE